jgi:hypothetical protein
MTDLKDLIAQQRVKIEQPKTESVDVVLGKELVSLEFARLLPDDWQALVATHPPRTTEDHRGRSTMVHADSHIGYDQHTLPRDYPADRIKVNGEDVDAGTWRDLYTVLNSVHKNNVGTTIWGLNVFDAIKELEALGKAGAGSPSGSPANRASRRAGSKASSQQK